MVKIVMLWLAMLVSTAYADDLEVLSDWRQVAERAGSERLPVMVMFSAEFCPYCMLMEEEVLLPLVRHDREKPRVVVVKVEMHSGQYLLDQQGQRISVDQWAGRYRVRYTPTLLFLDGNGEEIAPRMLGIQTVDLFWGSLERNIETSRAVLRSRDDGAD